MNKDDKEQLRKDLVDINFVDGENKIRLYELLTKLEGEGLDDYEKEEFVQIVEDEVDVGEKLKEFSDELVKDLS